jgi:hypothetical protein
MFRQELIIAVIILLIAAALLVGDRVYRVEGFTNWMTGVEKGFCGVDLPPCPFGTRCVNGHCSKDEVPYLPPTSGLPVLPVGYMV